MNIGIIGAGKMGSALSKCFSGAGHQIQICDSDPAKANKVASTNPEVQAVPISEICNDADLVINATWTSMAEELSKEFPKTNFIKGFNTVLAPIWENGPDYGQGQTATVFYCGNDDSAKQMVHDLIESTGFTPIDCGPLQSARQLEPMGLLSMQLAFNLGHGNQGCFTYVNRQAQAKTQAA